MTNAYLNRIATVVPRHDVHETFVQYAESLICDPRLLSLFRRLVDRSQINHRWSCLEPAKEPGGRQVDSGGFYRRQRFPSTAERMARFEREAVELAVNAVDKLRIGPEATSITHVVVVSCTGLFAPGLDIELIRRCGLPNSVERTTVGFMGCQAAINAIKLARHIVRSDPGARVLIVSVELCTLHLQETDNLEKLLSFLIFGDGCAAALVTAEPEGLALDRFYSAVEPEARDLITWTIGDQGFSMFLSGQVPSAVGSTVRSRIGDILADGPVSEIDHWAVHPGGRSVLDAVEAAMDFSSDRLVHSRQVLSDYGNMSSPTILFVLKRVLENANPGETGCAIAFGPGLSTESLLFRVAG